MNINEAFAILRKAHRTHTNAAAIIGLSPEHYSALRNSHAPIPNRTKELIIFKAKEASIGMPST